MKPKDQRYFGRLALSGEVRNTHHGVQKVHDILGLDVSHDTLNCALQELGFKPCCKVKKSKLMPKQKEERLRFAHRHEDWIDVDWKHVIFSDETTFRHFDSNQREWVWRRSKDALREIDVKETVKFRGGSLMF